MTNKSYMHTASYAQGHPNPQKFRENYTLLNGQWKFAFDQDDSGLSRGYQKAFPDDYLHINVPYAYQSAKSGIDLPDRQCDVVWYEREFDVADTDKKTVITFQAVDYKTTVFVNGREVLTHIGGYDIFNVDVTNFAQKGTNKLTLRVEDTMRVDQIRGKQRWRKNSFTCFYIEASGIVRDVYLETLNSTYIKDFWVKADYQTKTLQLTADICGLGCELELTVSDRERKEIKKEKFAVKDGKNTLSLSFDEVVGWSYGNPYLYNIELVLRQNEVVLDDILSYVGFVSIKTDSGRFYINGKDTYLKFVLDQGYYDGGLTVPTEQQIITDAQLMLDCGFNGARKHEHTPSPLAFYYMDLFGLYAWQECPSAHEYSYSVYREFQKQYPALLHDHFSHPCIIAYVVFNESWGIGEIRCSQEIQDVTEQMYSLVKQLAADRLVVSNDGWEHVDTDIVTFHNYAETYSDLASTLDNGLADMLKGENSECIRNFKRFFAGEYRYKGQPVMHSEFAGICFDADNKDGWGYGKSVDGAEGFLAKYADQLKFIFAHKEIRGLCMTQLTDVFQEKNGLVTMGRKTKVSPEKLKALHDKFE